LSDLGFDKLQFAAFSSGDTTAALPRAIRQFDPNAWHPSAIINQFPDLPKKVVSQKMPFDEWYRESSNCYLYALGDRSLFLNRLANSSDLGVIGGFTEETDDVDYTPNTLIDFVMREGLIPTGDSILWSDTARPTALFLYATWDFHFLRLDESSAGSSRMVWTQKNRQGEPNIVLDHYGHLLRDPRHFKIWDRYQFVSFVNIPDNLGVSESVIDQYQERGPLSILDYEQRSPFMRGASSDGKILIPQFG
jgi:hypothetical protein